MKAYEMSTGKLINELKGEKMNNKYSSIRLSIEVKKQLAKLKIHPRQSYEDVIIMVIKGYAAIIEKGKK